MAPPVCSAAASSPAQTSRNDPLQRLTEDTWSLYSVLGSVLLQLYQLASWSLILPTCKTEIITCISGPDENDTSVHPSSLYLGFLWWLSGQESACQGRRP